MYLRYIKLVNFKYFLSGMEKKEIEMEFDKNDNIIVVTGDNGSGKTSFAQLARTPFPISDIESGYGIKKGEAGKKIQIYVDEENNCEYEIKHIYNPKDDTHSCKSYFSIIKNGKKEEKNDNGSVYNFYDLIEEYFKINKDNIETLALTVKDLGVVTKKPAERRKYIKKIISGLEEIDSYLNIVKNKYSLIKKELDANKVKLSNYPDLEKIKMEITEVDKLISLKKSELKNIHKRMGTLEKLKKDDLDKLKKETKTILSKIKYTNKIIKKLDNIESKKSIQYNLDKFTGLIKRKKDKKKDLTTEINNINKNIINIDNELKSLEKLKKDNEYLKSLKSRIKNIDDSVKNFKPTYTLKEIEKIKNFFQSMLTTIEIIGENISNTNLLDKDIIKMNNNMSSKIKKIETEHNKKENELNEISSIHSDFDKKTKPHKDCKIDDCKLKLAYQKYLDNIDKINELEKKLNKLKEEIKELNVSLNIIKNDKQWVNKFNVLKNKTKKYNNIFSKDDLLKQFTSENIVNTIKKGIYNNLSKKIHLMLNQHDLYFKYLNDKEKLDSLSVMSDKENDLFKRYKQEKKDLKEKRKKMIEKRNEIDKDISKCNEKLDKLNFEHNDYMIENMNKDSLKKYIKSNNEDLKEIEDVLESNENNIEKINTLKKEEEIIEKEIKTNENKLKELNDKLSIMNHLEKEYKRLDKEERITYAIREVLRIHLPITVIDSFFESVKIHANKFLENANLPYRISDFEITDRIFRIETMKRDYIYEDVLNMSNGEISLTALALGMAKLAIIDNIKKYKIVVLDEVDSLLKGDKKIKYMGIVQKQAENFGISQLFIVTNNEHFKDIDSASHICFKDSFIDKYSNKNILYYYDDV